MCSAQSRRGVACACSARFISSTHDYGNGVRIMCTARCLGTSQWRSIHLQGGLPRLQDTCHQQPGSLALLSYLVADLAQLTGNGLPLPNIELKRSQERRQHGRFLLRSLVTQTARLMNTACASRRQRAASWGGMIQRARA